MENYEEFYRRYVYRVKAETSSAKPSRIGASSTIHFHGRPVLQPMLNEEQRTVMAEQRQKALRRERERHALRTGSQFAQPEDNDHHVLLQSLAHAEGEQCAEASFSDAQVLSFIISSNSSIASRRETLRLLNSRMERLKKRKEECGEEMDGSKVADLALQCCNGADRLTQIEISSDGEDTLSDKENESSALEYPLVEESDNFSTSAELSCSVDTTSLDSPLAGLPLSASLMGSYAMLPSPQPSCSPLTHHLKKTCPSPASNILISLPISESELSPKCIHETDTTQSKLHPLGNSSNAAVEHSSHLVSLRVPFSGELGIKKCKSISTSTPSSSARFMSRRPIRVSSTPLSAQAEHVQCRQKDRQSHITLDQHSPPAPLNQSYDVESPSPSLLRPHIISSSESLTEPIRRKLELKGSPQHLPEDRKAPGHMSETDKLQDKSEDEVHKQIFVLQSQHLNLEDKHAHQFPHQLKVQQKETQQLQQLATEQHKAVSCLTAMARGFLTRKLLQTEKIKHLRRTIQDSRELIRSFQADTQQRRASFTPQDLSLQHRVRAQLQASLHKMHEIFFVWPMRNRLALLQQDSELCNERRLRETEKTKKVREWPSLSSATQKSLDRKSQKQDKKLPQKPKHPCARAPQPAQRQTALFTSQKPRPVVALYRKFGRRTVESLRSDLSVG